MRADLEEYLGKRKAVFLKKKQRENLSGEDADKNFYSNVRNYQTAKKPRSFNVMDMMPLKTEQEAAGEVARYFNRISHICLLTSGKIYARILRTTEP